MGKYRYILICLMVIAGLAVLIGCSNSNTPTPTAYAAGTPIQQTNTTPQTNTTGTSTVQFVDPSSLANLAAMLDVVEHSVLQVNVTAPSTDISGAVTQSQGSGSAWVIDSNGTLVTAEHVIEGATSITVTTIEGKTYTAKVVKADPTADVAVLKANATGLPALKVGDASKLRVGTWVLVVGNPLGEGISAKQGIVSRLGVEIPFSATQTYKNMIEVSSAINPGNSGGPLVNLAGEVVGIAVIKVSDVGIEGMGYASNMTDNLPIIQKLSAQ